MSTVTKKELIDGIASRTRAPRAVVKQVVKEFLTAVIKELGEGNRLEFRDFGVFELKERSARIAQNPKTLQRVKVPAKLTVRFKAGRQMRAALDRRTLAKRPANGHLAPAPRPEPAVA